MKIKVISRGIREAAAGPEAESAIRSALLQVANEDAAPDFIASAIVAHFADGLRPEFSDDHYAAVTEDDGAELWAGWLDGRDEPAPTSHDQQPPPGNAEVAYERWIAQRNPEDVGSMAGFVGGWQTAVAAASGWPLCPNGCGCRLGAEDADQRDCACDGLCCYDEIEVSEVFAERDRLRAALQQLADDGNLEARDSLAGISAKSGQPS